VCAQGNLTTTTISKNNLIKDSFFSKSNLHTKLQTLSPVVPVLFPHHKPVWQPYWYTTDHTGIIIFWNQANEIYG
jgi:hypothetical protein